jgi:hypothetical protein
MYSSYIANAQLLSILSMVPNPAQPLTKQQTPASQRFTHMQIVGGGDKLSFRSLECGLKPLEPR